MNTCRSFSSNSGHISRLHLIKKFMLMMSNAVQANHSCMFFCKVFPFTDTQAKSRCCRIWLDRPSFNSLRHDRVRLIVSPSIHLNALHWDRTSACTDSPQSPLNVGGRRGRGHIARSISSCWVWEYESMQAGRACKWHGVCGSLHSSASYGSMWGMQATGCIHVWGSLHSSYGSM